MTAAASYRPLSRLELVFGLVYGAGVEIGPVEELLDGYLDDFGYHLESVRLSDAFPAMLGESGATDFPDATRRRQDQGDRLREHAGRDAAGRLAVFLMAGRRRRIDSDHPRRAWLVRSLRRPEEVQFLRQVYGPRFVLLAIHAPEALRLHNLTNRRREKSPSTSGPFEVGAIEDIKRDEQDVTVPHGQSMRTTFGEADFVVDSRSDEALKATLGRTIDILFGDPFATPSSDEQAMAHAYAAGVRSAEMGRQVGATLVDQHGNIAATGTNEVPAGGGGLYWSGRQPDHRDFKEPVPVDSNTEWKRRVARELLARLSTPQGDLPWLDESRVRFEEGECIVDDAQLAAFLKHVKGTRFADLIEFGRSVHAEMEAVLSAARRGVSVQDATVVCTTFPCHNCARHLIAAGVRRLVYLFPYAKSLARELHYDAIELDPSDPNAVPHGRMLMEQFIGVTPRGFTQYFDFSRIDRKDDVTGRAKRLGDRERLEPRVVRDYDTWSAGGPALQAGYLAEIEREAVQAFVVDMHERGLTVPEI
jgi:deoxycytidylate deaminase